MSQINKCYVILIFNTNPFARAQALNQDTSHFARSQAFHPFTWVQTLVWTQALSPFRLGANTFVWAQALSPFCLDTNLFTLAQALLSGCKPSYLVTSSFARTQDLSAKYKPFHPGARPFIWAQAPWV